MNRQRSFLERKNSKRNSDKAGQTPRCWVKIDPPEEVLERRRQQRMRVNTSIESTNSTRRLLWENIFLLVVLLGSLYGVFHLCLYLFRTSL